MEKMKTGQKVEAQKEELKQVEAYVNHHKLVELVARNKAMITELTTRLEAEQATGQAGKAVSTAAATTPGNKRPLRPDDLVTLFGHLQID